MSLDLSNLWSEEQYGQNRDDASAVDKLVSVLGRDECCRQRYAGCRHSQESVAEPLATAEEKGKNWTLGGRP